MVINVQQTDTTIFIRYFLFIVSKLVSSENSKLQNVNYKLLI